LTGVSINDGVSLVFQIFVKAFTEMLFEASTEMLLKASSDKLLNKGTVPK
jgi:hypothetical protein